MREIKFRVWDGNQWSYFKIGQSFGAWASSVYDDHCLHGRQFYQYTGLRDKNGKEIYEGDILGGYPHSNAFVRWNDEYACFESISYNDVVDECGDQSTEEVSELLANDLKDCNDSWQVIGSIYENPELLKP